MCCVAEGFASDPVDVSGDGYFVGHEVIEAHVDRSGGRNGVPVARDGAQEFLEAIYPCLLYTSDAADDVIDV